MKVLICHNYYRQAGGERAAVEAQAGLLLSRGHRVAWLTRDNAEIDDFTPLQKLRFPLDTVASRRTRREVRETVRRERPDIAHVHNVFPLLSPSLYTALGEAGVPVVQTLHNYRFMCPNGLFFTHGEICERCRSGNTLHAVRLRCYRDSRVLSAIYAASIGWHRWKDSFRHVDRFVALTPFTRKKIVEAGIVGRDRVDIVPNFLPAPVPVPLPHDQRDDYVLYLGRLVPEKGVDLAIEAVGGLPPVRLLVAGTGPEAASLEKLAGAVARDRVELVGYRGGAAKLDLLRRARLLVCPSRSFESQGLSVVEALAAGVPVVVAGHGGVGDMIEDSGAGLLHRPGDAGDLQQCIHRLWSDRALRDAMGVRAREVFERRYTARVHYRRLFDVYRRAGGRDPA